MNLFHHLFQKQLYLEERVVYPTKIEDVHYTNEKLEELMTGYKENQALAAKMFSERKRDMIENGTNAFIKPGDENSKYYTKPDEPPISHPAEVLERLQKEKPDAPMEELVKEADAIVAEEIEERRKETRNRSRSRSRSVYGSSGYER
jgi:Glu-tRNA(Gln) amidotransferase subunit E-like FAD-binding protein